MKNNDSIISAIRKEIENSKTRGAWDRGVQSYALEILDRVEEAARYQGKEPADRAELIAFMLNGAEDCRRPNDLYAAWSNASWGGCYEIYNGDIAARLCCPSELKKTRDGERRPNSREEWLDVQARALFQAGNRILKARAKVTA